MNYFVVVMLVVTCTLEYLPLSTAVLPAGIPFLEVNMTEISSSLGSYASF